MDRDQVIAAEVLREGFCLVRSVLDQKQVQSMRECIDYLLPDHGVNDELQPGGRVEWLVDPLELTEQFDWLLDAQPPFAVAQRLFGRDVHLYDLSVRISEPGTPAQDWHRDDVEVPFPKPPLWQRPLILTCFFHLDDAAATAGYECIRGSHLHDDPTMRGQGKGYSRDGYTRTVHSTTVLPQAGDLLLAVGGLLHRGLENRSSLRRRIIALSIAPALMRQRLTVLRGPRAQRLRRDANPDRALRLGAATSWPALEAYVERAHGTEFRMYDRPRPGVSSSVPSAEPAS